MQHTGLQQKLFVMVPLVYWQLEVRRQNLWHLDITRFEQLVPFEVLQG
jgi:hypothetical protein